MNEAILVRAAKPALERNCLSSDIAVRLRAVRAEEGSSRSVLHPTFILWVQTLALRVIAHRFGVYAYGESSQFKL